MAYFDYHEHHRMSDILIAFLCSAHMSRTFHRILRERAFARYKKASMQSTLYRLKKQGLVQGGNSGWIATEKGASRNQQKQLFDFIASPFSKKAPDYQIVSFDITESKRHIRNWLRSQLKLFGYRMIQQSLWIGPGPLPKEFNERLKKFEIKEGVRMFKITH